MTPVRWLRLGQADLPAGYEWLTPAEQARLGSFRAPKRRGEWLLGRWTAKQAVRASLAGSPPPAVVEVCAAPDGGPEVLLEGRPAPLVISLSHRAGLALCTVAAAGSALGCDLELVEARSDAFVADYLTAAERALVERDGPAHRALAVTLVWSAKESALKALRAGLRLDTRDVAVDLPGPLHAGPQQRAGASPAAARWRPLEVRHPAGGEVFAGWWRRDADLVTTVVAAPAPRRPECLGGAR